MNMNSISGYNVKTQSPSIFSGSLLIPKQGALQSTQEKMERMQKTSNQINYWEQKKSALKNMECEDVDEIAKKLNMFHTYEDQITAAKAEYNYEEMYHVLDEAKEKGEKIAEAAEKSKPKTEEERKEEMVEEALGTEESEGIMSEVLDKVSDITEEMVDMAEEELDDLELTADAALLKDVTDAASENTSEVEGLEHSQTLSGIQNQADKNILLKEQFYKYYQSIDFRV